MNVTHTETMIIGAGQAGLAISRELSRRNIEHIVLERHAHPGDVWRQRWQSLRLFTPARFDGLADRPFPAPADSFPTGLEFADYLDTYAEHFALPIHTDTEALSVIATGESSFVVETSSGQWQADRVVVAVGCGEPKVPACAAGLDPAISQLHSSQYRTTADLPEDRILVVGAGTSGTQLGIELAEAGRTVSVAGAPTMQVPPFILDHAGTLWFHFLHRVLTRSTPIGRRAASDVVRHGAPLIGIGPADLDAVGARQVPRLDGTRDGIPRFADGSTLDVDAVLWATGSGACLDWIYDLPLDEDRLPHHRRGRSMDIPGLAFMGLPFQYGLTSTLIGGTTRDAVHLADSFTRVHKNSPAP